MLIYNRIGELVFESNHLTKGWYGDFERNRGNHDVAGDVFVWKLVLQDFRGESHGYSGTVTLIR